jgi:hypothetical protein
MLSNLVQVLVSEPWVITSVRFRLRIWLGIGLRIGLRIGLGIRLGIRLGIWLRIRLRFRICIKLAILLSVAPESANASLVVITGRNGILSLVVYCRARIFLGVFSFVKVADLVTVAAIRERFLCLTT